METSENTALFGGFGGDEKNMSLRLFEYISRMIAGGELQSDYIFPNENELCAQLGVGRGTLREAYAMLSQYGYVTRTKRGTRVNSLFDIIRSSPLSMTTQSASPEEYKNFRILIEGEIAWFAAKRAGKADVASLGRKLDLFDKNASVDEMCKADMSFHLHIAEISRNVLLCNTIIAVSDVWKSGVRAGFETLSSKAPDILADIYNQHHAVFEAIKAHRPDDARNSMRAHLERAL